MKRILCAALALSALPGLQSLRAQGTMETLYSFVAPPGATYPAAGPIISQDQVIYGTTFGGGTVSGSDCGFFNCGTVYQLTRPASPGGSWTETTLYSFDNGGGGHQPDAGLVFGSGGTLYGWAQGGSGYATVFELTPPVSPGGAWTHTVVYNFQGPPIDGGNPEGNLAMGEDGSLYGTTRLGGTYNEGTVFELTPPASPGSAWTQTILYSFRGDGDGINPDAGVVIGANGAIYGTTFSGGALGYGTVFGLQLISGAWEEKVLVSVGYEMSNPVGLVLGKNGVLFGQWPNGIFKATPPTAAGGAWTVQSLYEGAPYTYQQSMTIGPTGALYWTTPAFGTSTACGVSNGCGTLNELVPPTSPGGSWTPVVLHNFTGQHGDGYQPNGGLVVTGTGAVYGTAYYGGDNFFGTAFRYTP